MEGIRTRTRTCDGGSCPGNVGIDEAPCICEKAFNNDILTDCMDNFKRVFVYGKDHRECEKLCRETEHCVAFVWSGSDSQTSYCHLQSAEDCFYHAEFVFSYKTLFYVCPRKIRCSILVKDCGQVYTCTTTSWTVCWVMYFRKDP